MVKHDFLYIIFISWTISIHKLYEIRCIGSTLLSRSQPNIQPLGGALVSCSARNYYYQVCWGNLKRKKNRPNE